MLTVGQELWYVPADARDRGRSCTVRVRSIGRKWAQVDGWLGQINIETWFVDGGGYSSPGRCWLNREAWEAEQRRLAAWDELRGITSAFAIPDVSEAKIREAIACLKANADQQSGGRNAGD